MNNCPKCNQGFSRRDNMLRHKRHMHDEVSNSTQVDVNPHSQQKMSSSRQVGTPPPPPPPPLQEGMLSPQVVVHSPPPPPPLQEGILSPQAGWHSPPDSHGAPPSHRQDTTVLYHPFTMMISGPTACGKTTFVKELLQNHVTGIKPNINRIVWLYRRWQPLYTLINKIVSPKVEFIQGIPADLDDDDFFDPKVNNLLVLDDLFSESGKDKRVTGLFTEGSHHRSLSVISINQNLFGTKDCTQRRNCHYLVLFDNPVDRQAMLTLARQMYPGNTDKFQRVFAKATKNPYGYLLVDLKPFTSENNRLKYAIEWIGSANESPDIKELTNQNPATAQKSINAEDLAYKPHLSVAIQTKHLGESSKESNTEDMADKGTACDDCGLLFDTAHDVQRHVKRGWCPETSEPPAKKQKVEENIQTIQEDAEDNEGFQHLWQLAQSCSKDRFNKLYDQYIDSGEKEDDATEMAEERVQPYKEKNFFQRYQSLLEQYWFPLMTNATHRGIVEQINDFRSKGLSLTSAVKRVLKKNRNAFEDLFETDESDDESEEDSDEEDSE